MRKLLVILTAALSMNAAAQNYLQDEPDTMRVTWQDNGSSDYLLGKDYYQIDFTSPDALKLWLSRGQESLNRPDIRQIRFYNRYSNPQKLLKGYEESAYNSLFYTQERPEATFFMVACLCGDEMLGGGGRYDEWWKLDLLCPDALANATSTWDQYYSAIAKVNTVMEKLTMLPPEREVEGQRAKGEALFLRAYLYYELASIYGPVPLVLDNNSWADKVRKTSPIEVWGRIMQDLKDAIALMEGYSPTLSQDDSRVGKYAAEALLARAFLFYTGFYEGFHDVASSEPSAFLPDGTELTKAEVTAYVEDCINNSGFSLVTDYRNLWPYTNSLTVEQYPYTAGKGLEWVEDKGKVNPEVLFKIKYNKEASWSTTTGYSNQYALWFGINGYGAYGDEGFPFGSGWGAAPVSPQFFTDWATDAPDDMRRDASIQDITELSGSLYGRNPDLVQATRYHEKKTSAITATNRNEPFETIMFADGNWESNISKAQLGNIHPLNVIRLADVLLMHSELTGTTNGINRVRARAGLPPINQYSLAALQEERKHELAFEGVRWNDMRRWGDAYCKTALDKQMGVEVYNIGVLTSNPGTLDPNSNKTYAQRYTQNHGFFQVPGSNGEDGFAVIKALQGKWTFNDTFAGGCYGTLKYNQSDADDFIANPADNGLMKSYTLKGMQTAFAAANPAEVSQFAWMEISGNTVTKYDCNGQLLAQGTLSLTLTDNYDWRICSITITDNALLYDKSYRGSEPQTFDLIAMNDDSGLNGDECLVLVDAMGMAKGREATFWALRHPTNGEEAMHIVNGVKWSYGVTESYVNGYSPADGTVTIGTIGLCSWADGVERHGTVPGIYAPHIASTTAADLHGYLRGQGIAANSKETDPYAYMVFSLEDMSIKKYSRSGELIGTGTFETENDLGLNSLRITTSEKATLSPYIYNGAGETEHQFLLGTINSYWQVFYRHGNYPALILRNEDSYFTYWLYAPRGLTEEEFADKLEIVQQDRDGNTRAEGRYLQLSLDYFFSNYANPEVECTSLDGTTVERTAKNCYKVIIPRGETRDVPLEFTLYNCNGFVVTTTKTLTISNDEPLPQEVIMLATADGSKTWTWDNSLSGGTVWGNMGYGSYTSADVNQSQWWGITSEEDFAEYTNQTNDGLLHGDESFNATMVFNSNGTMKKYDGEGNLMQEGSYEIVGFHNDNPSYIHEMGKLKITAGAILWPYAINTNGSMPSVFEIACLTDDKLTLVYPQNGAFNDYGSWCEATYWHFKKE
jgi:hypothetical protein